MKKKNVMKKKNEKLAIALCGFCGAVALAGCGRTTKSSSGDNPGAATSAAAATPMIATSAGASEPNPNAPLVKDLKITFLPKKVMQAHPKLKGIISPTTIGVAAAARYLDSSEYKGKVALTGVGTPNQLRKFIKDGTMTSFALWDPGHLGYLATYASVALASGQITGKPGEKFKAGDLGEYTIGANSEVVLGPPMVFSKDNIDKYDF